MRPEGWVVATVEHGQIDEVGGDFTTLRFVDLSGRPVLIKAPSTGVSRPAARGPYLALGAAELDSPSGAPRFQQVTLVSIYSTSCPVPVDSHYERSVVRLLQLRELAFVKPVAVDALGLLPDFLLPDYRILIEVQGLDDEKYLQDKREKHAQIRSSQTYAGWTLVTWDPHPGRRETLAELADKLPLRRSLRGEHRPSPAVSSPARRDSRFGDPWYLYAVPPHHGTGEEQDEG
jgi:hypothetical protein